VKGGYPRSNNKSQANKNFTDLLTKDLSPSAFREPQLTWVYGEVDNSWILKVQNKIRIYFRIEKCMVVVKSHST
jgi:hypothetical protein